MWKPLNPKPLNPLSFDAAGIAKLMQRQPAVRDRKPSGPSRLGFRSSDLLSKLGIRSELQQAWMVSLGDRCRSIPEDGLPSQHGHALLHGTDGAKIEDMLDVKQ